MFRDASLATLLLAILVSVYAHAHPVFIIALLLLTLLTYRAYRNVEYSQRLQAILNKESVRHLYAVVGGLVLIYIVAFLAGSAETIHPFVVAGLVAATPLPLLLSWTYRRINSPVSAEHNDALSLRTMFVISASLLSIIGLTIIADYAYKVPAAVGPVSVIILSLLAALPVAGLAHNRQHMHKKLSAEALEGHLIGRWALAYYGCFGILNAALAYANFLFFFVRHNFSPRYIDTALPDFQQASTVAVLTLLLTLIISAFYEQAERHDNVDWQHITHNRRLLALSGATLVLFILCIYIPMLRNLLGLCGMDIFDLLSAIAAAALLIAVRGVHRHTRKHSRRAVIQLHKEVKG